MSERSVNLDMPFIAPAQAQKHVTHNEALLRLDAVVQLSIVATSDAAPAAPAPGERHLVGENPTGSWSGHGSDIAIRQDGYWAFATPATGWLAWFEEDSTLKAFDGTDWRPIGLADHVSALTLGINATADETNRLSVASPATLLTHAGAGHQLKINKAVATDTASLLFQSGWTGHAEMGLTGNTDFSIKVSDGSEWRTGLAIDTAGRVTRPSQPAARAYRAGANFTPTSGQQSGVTAFSVNQGGFAVGAAVAGGGNALVVPATGLYLMALTTMVTAAPSAYGVGVSRNGSQSLLSVTGTSGSTASLSASTIVQLQQGDTLTFAHTGSATFMAGANGTNLSVTMI